MELTRIGSSPKSTAGRRMAWLGLAAIPAIGPFLAGGAIGTALVGAAAGGITGGVLGGLLGLGIPRHKAEYHEEQVRAGRTLVTVQTAEPAIAERIFSAAGAVDIDRGGDEVAAADHDEAASARAIPVGDGDDLAQGNGPMAVPAHEVRETHAYREAGVPATSEADTVPEWTERGSTPVAGAAGRDRSVIDESGRAPSEERTYDDATYDEVHERAVREELRR